jgi:ectoine hydroxylase-related dioxygenase (phytanoyl-CoA dioxygenase family)
MEYGMAEVATAGGVRGDARGRVLANIHALGLTEKLAELEANGFAVIRGVLDEDEIARAKRAIKARVEERIGGKVDLEEETSFKGMQYIPHLIDDDEVFTAILLKPQPLALITWLLGESCELSSMGCHFRGPGGMPLMLHSDNGNGTPSPFSPVAFVANVNYALTPYSRERGSLAVVPGSHLLARQPLMSENFTIKGLTPAESANRIRSGGPFDGEWNDPPHIEAMNIAPGDAVIWHGNTWHGSFRREVKGVRMNLSAYFCRQFVQTQERRERGTREMLARHTNDPRLSILLGAKQPYGWGKEGPDYALMAQNPRSQFD